LREPQVIASSSTEKTWRYNFVLRHIVVMKFSCAFRELADRNCIMFGTSNTQERKFCGAQMLHDAPIAAQNTPHVIVVGNHKGGSGKTTIAMLVAVALSKEGQRVGTIISTAIKRASRYIEIGASGQSIRELNSK
jgi:Mrp family chromosome partitioning ATPase